MDELLVRSPLAFARTPLLFLLRLIMEISFINPVLHCETTEGVSRGRCSWSCDLPHLPAFSRFTALTIGLYG